jgi:hypothetical protein
MLTEKALPFGTHAEKVPSLPVTAAAPEMGTPLAPIAAMSTPPRGMHVNGSTSWDENATPVPQSRIAGQVATAGQIASWVTLQMPPPPPSLAPVELPPEPLLLAPLDPLELELELELPTALELLPFEDEAEAEAERELVPVRPSELV